MSEERIDELWNIAYGNSYLRMPYMKKDGSPARNEYAERWLHSLSARPHQKFARLIEAELNAEKP